MNVASNPVGKPESARRSTEVGCRGVACVSLEGRPGSAFCLEYVEPKWAPKAGYCNRAGEWFEDVPDRVRQCYAIVTLMGTVWRVLACRSLLTQFTVLMNIVEQAVVAPGEESLYEEF